MWFYDFQKDLFWHSQTEIVILGDDMPEELMATVALVGQAPAWLLP